MLRCAAGIWASGGSLGCDPGHEWLVHGVSITSGVTREGDSHLVIVLRLGHILALVVGDSVDGLVVQVVDLVLHWSEVAGHLRPRIGN